MKQKTKILLVSMVISVFCVLPVMANAEMMGMWDGQGLSRASFIIGASVSNPAGERLGTIRDLTINPRGKVNYAIISQGKMMGGMGEELVAVPMRALTFTGDSHAILNISKAKLASAPSFQSDNWPNMTSRQWMHNTNIFYGMSPMWRERVDDDDDDDDDESYERMEPARKYKMEQEKMKNKAPSAGYGY
ncbi:MAG: PRC-barrel domain-containing protein [Nitrospira sp.]|nr:PRC-barrel domain-containing protein [bacterium]MBL7050228.1 PRC-barrel domain-containing protein [Nitrospira sp.]